MISDHKAEHFVRPVEIKAMTEARNDIVAYIDFELGQFVDRPDVSRKAKEWMSNHTIVETNGPVVASKEQRSKFYSSTGLSTAQTKFTIAKINLQRKGAKPRMMTSAAQHAKVIILDVFDYMSCSRTSYQIYRPKCSWT